MSDIPVDPPEHPDTPPAPGDAPPSGSINRDDSRQANPEATVSDSPGDVSRDDPADAAGDLTIPTADSPASSAPPTESPLGRSQLCQGKVTRITSEEVIVELDAETQGAVPIIEFAGQPIPVEGDEISVMVERADPSTGLIALSKRHADTLGFWESVGPGDVLEGVVTGMNRGGLDIDIGGARAFLPEPQVDVRRMRDISILIGEHIQCVVTQVDPATRDLIVSRRKFIENQRRKERIEKLNTLAEGETRPGTVCNITDYGAFIDLGGGVEGLVHVNDMSWSRVRHPSEVVHKGQQLQVRVLKVNRETGKVSLGLKQTRPDPWEGIETRYREGARVTGRLVRMVDFGAFLELEEGIDALLPVSEMSWSRRVVHPSERLNVGETAEVVVLNVDPGRRRISVGLKQTEENPWTAAESRFPANAKVDGRVSKVMDFGAFVELAPGVEGLVHISELSDRRVGAVSDILQEGQEVQVRVLKVDTEAQRISLSMRPPRQAPRAAPGEQATPDKSKKKRKKPLRGGLSSHFQWW